MRRFLAVFFTVGLVAFGAPVRGEEEGRWNEYTIRPSDVPSDAPKFVDFPASPYNGINASPLLMGNKEALQFRTRIRNWAKEKPNFAGHYILATWGCGSDCTSITFINAISGKVIMQEGIRTNAAVNIHDDLMSGNGIDWHGEGSLRYRPDSRLLVVIGMPEEEPKLRGISYFVMDNDHLERIRFIHKS